MPDSFYNLEGQHLIASHSNIDSGDDDGDDDDKLFLSWWWLVVRNSE